MITQDYTELQSNRDAEYLSAYRQWVQSLPDDEQRSLRSVGLDSPMSGHHGNGAPTGDAADSPVMSNGHDPALEPQIPEPVPHPICNHEKTWDILRRLVEELLYHDNARLTVECLSLVSGLSYTGCSMTEIGQRHGITRAAVSKRCIELTDLLGIPHSRAMRSQSTRAGSRQARLRVVHNHEQSNHTPNR